MITDRVFFKLPDDSSSLSCKINPVSFNPKDEAKVASVPSLNSGATFSRKAFDSEVRIMKWDKFEVANHYMLIIENYFRNHIGEKHYILLNNIESMDERWPDSARVVDGTDEYRVGRIVDIVANYQSGGVIRYSSLEVYIQPERP